MRTNFAASAAASCGRLALGFMLATASAPIWAQAAPENQTPTNPMPPAAATDAEAGANNSPGPAQPTGAAGTPAATAAGSPTGGVEEIVVTAQFREQNVQSTPLAITAVSGAMLEARSQTNIAQVANQAPSVTLKPQGAAFGPSLGANIRGVGQFDFNPALEPGVGLYVDDVYYATLTGSIFDLLDLERVEILRGPQGTLTGRNSIGGAVKLYSQMPKGSNTGYIQAAYGSRNRIDLRASGDFKLLDNLFVRLAGVAKKQGGYVKRLDFGCVNPAGSALNPTSVGGVAVTPIPAMRSPGDCKVADDGEVDYNAVRAVLRYEPTDRFDVTLIGDYTIDDRNVAGSVLLRRSYNGAVVTPNFNNPARDIDPYTPNTVPAAQRIPLDSRFLCGKYCNYASFVSLADGTAPLEVGDGRTKYKGYGFSGQINWKLTDQMQLVSITAYRNYLTIFTNDDDATPLAHSFGRGHLTFHSFSQELRLNGSFGDNDQIEYTVGGYYSDQKSVYATLQDLRYAGLPPFAGDDPVNADSKAAFAHLSWKPVEPLTLIAGIRYTNEHKDYTYSRKTPTGGVLGPPLGPLNGVKGVYDGPQSTRFDYRLNASYELTPDMSVYAQWSTGFKGGGINPRPFFPQQVLPFGPETLQSYEAGFKSELFDRHVRFNLAAYYSQYHGIQLSLSDCTAQAGAGFGVPCALIANAGNAHIKGFEAETSARLAEGFLIDTALSLIDFKYTSINPAAGGPGRPNGPQLNDYPTYTPKWKWSIGTQYAIDLGNAGTLTPRFDASYQSVVYSNATNRPSNRINAYTLANARLTWTNVDKDLEVSGEVTNLFDRYYFLTNFDLTIAGAGIATGQPGRPREWALSVKKKF